MALLKSFKLLGDRHARLVLAGAQKETYKDCARFVRENKLEAQVTFLHDVSNSELPLLYRCAQSFVYPSMLEGFGIPLIEAACAGLPIAANSIDVFKEIAPESTMFFDAEDTTGFSSVLREVMQMSKQDYHGHLKIFKAEFAAERMMNIYKGEL